MRLSKLTIYVLFISLVAQVGTLLAVPSVRINKSAKVTKDVVTLADIATIKCQDQALLNRLNNTVIGRVALSGVLESFSIKRINTSLTNNGISPFSLDIYGATQCRVAAVTHRKSLFSATKGTGFSANPVQSKPIEINTMAPRFELVSKEQLESAINKKITKKESVIIPTIEDELKRRIALESGFNEAELLFEWNQYNRVLLDTPLEKRRFKFNATRTVDLGPVSFKVQDNQSKTKVAKIVSGRVYYLAKTVVAKETLRKDDIITKENVEIKALKIQNRRDLGISDMTLVLNQQVRSHMNKGQSVSFRNIKRLELVRKGDRVVVTYKSGGIQGHYEAVAQGSGAFGDMIIVANLYNTKQKNSVMVKGPGQVEKMIVTKASRKYVLSQNTKAGRL